MAIPIPVIGDIKIEQLIDNPYPIYKRLRKEAPIAWIPDINLNLVTCFDTIKHIDTNPRDFPAYDPKSLQIRAFGHSMMRKDGDAHKADRAVVQQTVKGNFVKEYWAPRFEWIVNDLIDGIQSKGEADLFSDFAAPMASRCLMEMLGLINVRWDDLCEWSQTLMDAVGNYGDDPVIWAKQEKVAALINEALDQMIEIKRIAPDPSFISMLANAPDMSLEQIRANIKVIIGGGLNEPRDATCNAVYSLLANPEQRALLENSTDDSLWKHVFEESIRHCAPIGMYPRRVAEDIELDGFLLKKGDLLGLSVASACHDEKYWADGDKFDIARKRRAHLAFGTGPHLCLGFHMARMQVGQLSVPNLFKRLPGLRLDHSKKTRYGGWVFRGPLQLPVKWDV